MKRKILQDLLEPTITGLGYELVGIELLRHGRSSLLRLYIDQPSGITVDDCARVSHQVSGIMDVEEPLVGAYTLEVSSPGLERPLFYARDYLRFKGQRAVIRLGDPVEGRRNWTGMLAGFDQGAVLFDCSGQAYRFPLTAITKAHLAPET
jgi:ribosome maturation factor RimP